MSASLVPSPGSANAYFFNNDVNKFFSEKKLLVKAGYS